MSHSSQENNMLPSINTSSAYAPQQQQHQSFSSSPETQTQNGNGHGHGIYDNFQRNDYTSGPDQTCNDKSTLHSPNDVPDISQKPHGQKPNNSFLTLLPQSYPPVALPSIPSLDATSTGIPQSYSGSSSDHYGGQRMHSAEAVWHPNYTQPYLHLNGQMHSAPPTADNSFQAFQGLSSRFQHSAVPPVTAPLTLPHEYAAFHPESPFQAMPSEPGPLQHQQSRFPTHHSTDGQSTAPIFPLQTHQPYLIPMPTSAPYQLPSMRPSMHFSHSFSGAQGDAMYSPAAMDGSQQSYYFQQQSDTKAEQEGASASDMGHSQQLATEQQERTTNLSQSLTIDPSISVVAPHMMYPAVYESAGLTGSTSQEYYGQDSTRLQTVMNAAGSGAQHRHEIIDVDQQNNQASKSGPVTHSEKETPSRAVRPRGKPGPKPKPKGAASSNGHGDVGDQQTKSTAEERPKKKSKKRPATDDSDEVTGVKANGKGNQFILTLYEMVESTSSYPLIGWNLPGNSIVIPDSKAFAAGLLNQYFRHSTISSFARQLVSYGFMKTELQAREKAMFNNSIRNESRHWTFTHNFFLRGRADLLDRVVPQTSSDRQQKPPAKRSQATVKREEDAFIDVLKRENMQWRERCTRMEHAMMEEKARAYQYYALLVQRGIIARETPVIRAPKRDTPLLMTVPAAARQDQQFSRTPHTDCQGQKEPSEDELVEVDEVRKQESRSPASNVQRPDQ
ncbi:hypothetical protein QFC21_002769 [Naganishia friedmannii]|uniref:Uncharacterized protein n=1 Tax=Naganishia friedmannii TaxID=89922 RepID=A0ACC2VSG4_9TREE|nr:hypothetical protein QFC21_002769 [Naganishia friedmannii]